MSAFTYAFKDSRWPYKLGALVLLGCIPGLNMLAWVGYQQSIAYNIAHQQPILLPAWDDWADILVRGLISVTASAIYWLPVGFLALIGLFPGTRLLAFLALIAAIVLGLGLSIGHVGYAYTDQPGTYSWAGWRSPKTKPLISPVSYLIGFASQTGVILIAALFTPFALVTLIGPMVIWSAVSVINGYILGQLAVQRTGTRTQIDRFGADSVS